MKSFKHSLIIIVCFLLGCMTVVGANQAIQAIQNTEVKVSLNGIVQNFKDETTGEVQYPITYHDRTYLPLRNVAKLAGLNVDYDASSNTAILKTKDSINQSNDSSSRFKPYFDLIKANENNREKKYLSNIEYKATDILTFSYVGDLKFDTKVVEDAVKLASKEGKLVFSIKSTIGDDYRFYVDNNKINASVYSALSKEYKNIYLYKDNYYLVNEKDGYYLISYKNNSKQYIQAINDKNVLELKCNSSDIIHLSYGEYEVIASLRYLAEDLYILREISDGLLQIKNDEIYLVFDEDYIDLRIEHVKNNNTSERAQLAVFTNNFSQYNDRFVMDGLNLKQILGVTRSYVNDAQLYYMVANGLRTPEGDSDIENMELPVGYVLPDTIKKIYNIQDDEVVAYVIDDKNITGYNAVGNNTNGSAGYEFYGDTNGEEYHFVTSNGHVFTLPGHRMELEDGTMQYHISNEKGAYYVTKGFSNLDIGSFNVNGDKIEEDDPILASDLIKGGLHGLDKNNNEVKSYSFTSKEGRNTIIK